MSSAAPVAGVENHEFINKLAKKLPAIWPGYALGAAFYFTAAYVFAVYGRAGLHPALFIVSISSFLYYLYCVYRFYSVLESVPGWNSPNSAWGAVGRNFIPIFSYFWLFEWISSDRGICELANTKVADERTASCCSTVAQLFWAILGCIDSLHPDVLCNGLHQEVP